MACLASNIHLRFICNKLKVPVYTHKKISTVNGHDVEVAIYRNDEAIRSGPLSSLKVEMVVLPGDFSRENNSTAEEVDRQTVISRHGQGSVLDGVLSHKLVNGSYSFADISFREGSVRTRTRKFILAARVDMSEDIDGLRIQEAFMDPVTVLDRRSEANEKSDPPKLKNEVYRLKRIAKNGAYFRRLQEENIITVQSFLKAYYKDQTKLREILEIKSEKCMVWETMVQHAMECDLKDMHELKAYKVVGENVQIFFNCVDNIVGAEFDGVYIAKENFNTHQKALVDRKKIQAYNELKSIGLNYVMSENGPHKFFRNVGDSSFRAQDAVPQPNTADQNASFQASDNSGRYSITLPQTIPRGANCSTAAMLIRGGGGASEPPFDYHIQVVNHGGNDGRFPHYGTAAAVEEDTFDWESMLRDGGLSPGVLLASSDQANHSALPFPSPTPRQMRRSGNENIYFNSDNASVDPYQQGPRYYSTREEMESQYGGIVVPAGNVTPFLSAQNPTPKSTYISQGSDFGYSFSDGTW